MFENTISKTERQREKCPLTVPLSTVLHSGGLKWELYLDRWRSGGQLGAGGASFIACLPVDIFLLTVLGEINESCSFCISVEE